MRILFPTTRDLCYFSADFFAEQITTALERQGAEVVRLPMPERIVDGKPVTPDFSPLEAFEGQHFDAIIDINSKLPYLEAEPGVRYLDTFDAPFFNIILDHPLYHHPGLSFRLKHYYTVTIDRCHNAYIGKYYPWIMQTFYLPLAGTLAEEAGAGTESTGGGPNAGTTRNTYAHSDERFPCLLFPGTFEPEPCLYEEVDALPDWAGAIVRELYGEWNPEEEPMEEAVSGYLESLPPARIDEIRDYLSAREQAADFFPVIMNYLYPLDRLTRFLMRKRVITALAEAGVALDIQGEGWEMTDVFDHPNVKSVPPMPIGPSIETMAKYRAILDINPNFYAGLHDRVSTAVINGCLTFSSMSEETAPKTPLFRHYSSYDTDALCEAVLDAQKQKFLPGTETKAGRQTAAGGKLAGNGMNGAPGSAEFPITWDTYAERVISIIHEIF